MRGGAGAARRSSNSSGVRGSGPFPPGHGFALLCFPGDELAAPEAREAGIDLRTRIEEIAATRRRLPAGGAAMVTFFP